MSEIPPETREEMEKYGAWMRLFLPNRYAFPLDELMKYEGQWLAWSHDGTSIIASSSESPEAVWNALVAAGMNPSEHVFDYIPDSNYTHLGGL
jgi:hypothetical protein